MSPRVLLVEPVGRGGMAHYAAHTAQGLAALAEVKVATSAPRPSYLEKSGVEYAPLPPWAPSPRALLSMRRGFARLVSSWRPDVVHFVAPHVASLALFGAARRARVAYTVHDVDPHPGEDSPLRRAILRAHLRAADAVLAHSEAARDKLRARGVRKAMGLVEHGPFSLLAREATGAAAGNGYFLFFGRFVEYKGLSVLGDAWEALAARHPEARLRVVGQGDTRHFLARFRSSTASIESRFVPDEEIPALFAGARALVAPYLEASQSGVVALAHAFGTPVVASDLPAFRREVAHEEDGLLVPPGDAAALAAALERVIQDPETAARWGERGRRKASVATWERNARVLLDLCSS